MEQLQVTAAEAQRFYDSGRVAVADAICRSALKQNAGDEASRRLLARVAGDFGEAETAARILSEAGVRQDRTPAAGDAWPGLPDAWPGAFVSGQKYLLIKAWGNGFCSDLDHTLGLLLVAEMSGRTPVIHWGRNSLFGVDPEQDAWREFFHPVSPVTIDDLAAPGHDFWPPKWNAGNLRVENLQKLDGEWSRLSGLQGLNRPERVVVADYFTGVPSLMPWLRPGHPLHGRSPIDAYRYLIAKYLHPRAEILEAVERFAAERLAPGTVRIAAHIRGSDKLVEDPQLPQKISLYPQLIRQFEERAGGGRARVFLMTDSSVIRAGYQERLGPALVATDCIRTETQVGLHLQAQADRKRLGVEVLIDCLLAARCDCFIGLGSSNVTCFIYHLRPWTAQNCVIIGPLMTHMVNPYLYMTHEQLDRFLPAGIMARLRVRAREAPLDAGYRAALG